MDGPTDDKVTHFDKSFSTPGGQVLKILYESGFASASLPFLVKFLELKGLSSFPVNHLFTDSPNPGNKENPDFWINILSEVKPYLDSDSKDTCDRMIALLNDLAQASAAMELLPLLMADS